MYGKAWFGGFGVYLEGVDLLLLLLVVFLAFKSMFLAYGGAWRRLAVVASIAVLASLWVGNRAVLAPSGADTAAWGYYASLNLGERKRFLDRHADMIVPGGDLRMFPWLGLAWREGLCTQILDRNPCRFPSHSEAEGVARDLLENLRSMKARCGFDVGNAIGQTDSNMPASGRVFGCSNPAVLPATARSTGLVTLLPREGRVRWEDMPNPYVETDVHSDFPIMPPVRPPGQELPSGLPPPMPPID